MHWLIVSAEHHPTHGGIGAYVASFVHMARGQGWEVDLVTRRSRLLPRGARVHPVSTPDQRPRFAARVARLREIELIRPYRYGLWAEAVARKLLELEVRPDVIEVPDAQAQGFVALRSERVRRHFAGVPMIVHAHTPMHVQETINGADPDRFGRPLYHAWEQETLAAADGVLAPSRGILARVGAEAGTVIPLPVAPLPLSAAAPRELIVVAGSVQRIKGIEAWIDSLNEVLRARPRAHAVLIGPDTTTGPGGTSMLDACRSRLDPALADRFRHAGALGRDETIGLIGRAGVVVVPSLFESFSMTAAEGILRGRPTIVTTATGIAEHVPDLPAVEPGDVRALAEAQVAALASWPDAHETALRCRDQLLDITAPSRQAAAREAFARTLSAQPVAAQAGGPDAIEAMGEILRRIEAREHAYAESA
jgi:glycosyltransferase involved in cell wall biosynthesis